MDGWARETSRAFTRTFPPLFSCFPSTLAFPWWLNRTCASPCRLSRPFVAVYRRFPALRRAPHSRGPTCRSRCAFLFVLFWLKVSRANSGDTGGEISRYLSGRKKKRLTNFSSVFEPNRTRPALFCVSSDRKHPPVGRRPGCFIHLDPAPLSSDMETEPVMPVFRAGRNGSTRPDNNNNRPNGLKKVGWIVQVVSLLTWSHLSGGLTSWWMCEVVLLGSDEIKSSSTSTEGWVL